MANKQQKAFKKKGLASRNMGPNTQVSPVNHSTRAFMKPDVAIAVLKESGSRSWKITKRHPANVQIKQDNE